jgi:hypothetical protein
VILHLYVVDLQDRTIRLQSDSSRMGRQSAPTDRQRFDSEKLPAD